MREVFGRWGVAAETKSTETACGMCFAPVAAETLASCM